ncbi:MAG TPA: hypothetical protein VHE77_02995, partial [Dongiaceae bacterium]|nr:hypothetical protein [Dongiaceae bacterium]
SITLVPGLFPQATHVFLNGREVYGEERRSVELHILLVFLPIAGFFLVWYGRRLLPNSPFDFLEFGPRGLTVGGILGRRHIAWEDIAGFTVGVILLNPPIIWVKAEPCSADLQPLRFTMGGYVGETLFSFGRTRTRVVAEWLDRVREAYTFDNMVRSLPPPPEAFVGRIIRHAQDDGSRSSSVIER